MLHTKFRENRPAGSRVDAIWRVFTIYGRGGHLDHVTQMPWTNFRSPYPRRLHIKFVFDSSSGFREENLWKCERTDDGLKTDDGRTTDHGYTKSSPMSLRLRWAKTGARLCVWVKGRVFPTLQQIPTVFSESWSFITGNIFKVRIFSQFLRLLPLFILLLFVLLPGFWRFVPFLVSLFARFRWPFWKTDITLYRRLSKTL